MKTRIYLIQSDYSTTPIHLVNLSQTAQSNDLIILMGDAVLHYHSPLLVPFQYIYVIQPDEALICNAKYPDNLHIIDYDEFARLIVNHEQCIRLN